MLTRQTYFLSLVLLCLLSTIALADYSHKAQKSFLHKDLGKIYLGMSMTDLSREIVLSKAEVTQRRFDFLELEVNLDRKHIESVRFRVDGLTREEKARLVFSESNSDDEVKETARINVGRIPKGAFLYAIYITFKPQFNLKKYGSKIFGAGEDRKEDDPYYFYDTQWNKKTSDGLSWLVRAFHSKEKRELQLLGRIPGTEWETK